MNFTSNKPILYNQGDWSDSEIVPPDEINTDLTVNGEYWITLSCSPFQIEELAIGFLFNEHILTTKNDIVQIWLCKDYSNIDVWLSHPTKKPDKWLRTSGCTGGNTTQSKSDESMLFHDGLLCPELIIKSFEILLTKQTHYRETRGIHSTMLTDGSDIRFFGEDIGRHNTLDKIAGMMLLNPRDWQRKIIFTTGRISSEMLQKSAHLGAATVVSRTSPTKASIVVAQDLNITLIGYVRSNQFIIYSHPEYIAMTVPNQSELKIICD